MKRWFNLAVLTVLSFCLAIALSAAFSRSDAASPYTWQLPAWTPPPNVPTNNPMSAAKVELGRHLFYEKRLSVMGEFSCATCHDQARAFTEKKSVSIGVTGEAHPRNAMSLANIAYNSVLTWANPLMTDLETQLLVPIFGEHPIEMGMAGKETELIAMLKGDPNYQKLFTEAFGNEEISINTMAKAIAAFERSLVSFNSPYDQYRYGGNDRAISEAAKRGEALFESERLECFHCHGGINFSDSITHSRLAFKEIAFHNTGLYNLDGKGAYPPNNTGIKEITLKPSDMGRFKAPTLRNIALTAPYMHDGSIPTLEKVIEHYSEGGRTIHAGKWAGVGNQNPLKSSFIKGFKLSDQEKQDLLEFLRSLTDESFIQNPAFRDPNVDRALTRSD
ncbi:methanobactin export MATE transporter MbnM [Leptolyngbya sp. NIES-2104]|uniref:methanobactin export MATE transporter MbnM n=1 Tax=Leptolyngbya sp. NIES-2104 TaxID=1552121 RepID=UPI0006EC71FF|nr:methanobactin export MATE transporter MbnM [Leptolyngbya sp. NIES-2104]GAP97881.1 cytochrome c551 peroxidase precursor [Leptolyngbya sp. NIES-2104]